MTAKRGTERFAYEPEEFAARHGLSVEIALIILRANRGSKQMADKGAEALKRAAAERLTQKPR